MDGSWQQAIDEAQRAAERCLKGENPVAAGEAHYQRGEVHRLRGEEEAAETAYREASGQGWEPQPGLALLEVLRLLSTGETNREIAAALVLSVRTVDRHVSNIYAKLGVSSRAAAASYAHEHGLVRSVSG
jgi:DNA-binding NarL/FixJ family response regulator